MKLKKSLLIILAVIVVFVGTISYLNAASFSSNKSSWNMWWWWFPRTHRMPKPTKNPTSSVKPSTSVTPTVKPTPSQSVVPSDEPSIEPSIEPSVEPSVKPSPEPSVVPSVKPSEEPANNEQKKSIDIILVNSTGVTNNLWIGSSKEIVAANELESGKIRYEKLDLIVQDGVLKDKVTVNVAQNGAAVTKTIDVTGKYVEGKPVVAMWNGTEFQVTYSD